MQSWARSTATAAQIILRWHIQSGNIVIPGSKNPEHIKANFDPFDFSLTDEEMEQAAALNKNARYCTSAPELLKKYAEMVPPVDEQKKRRITCEIFQKNRQSAAPQLCNRAFHMARR